MKLGRRFNFDKTPNGWCHYCPACKHLHCFTVEGDPKYPKQSRWSFDGNLEKPTFGPGAASDGRSSMLIYVTEYDHDKSGWIIGRKDKNKEGEVKYATKEEADKALPNEKWESRYKYVGKRNRTLCHYHLQAGMINFCADCPHELKGQSVPLPDLPEGYVA